MAENKIEIEVELTGQKNALKGLDQVKEGAEGIGETFKGVGEIVGKTNQQMGESLSAVSDAVSEGAAAFEGIRDAISSVGDGSANITTLLGPLTLLVGALGAVYEAYRQMSGAAKEAQLQQEAMAASAADSVSKLEELAEKGITYAKNQLMDYVRANLQAQVVKERLETRTQNAITFLQAEADETKKATKAAQAYAKSLSDRSLSYQQRVIAETKMKEALASTQIATQRSKTVYEELVDEMIKVNDQLDGAAKKFKTLEEKTDEGLQTKAKELVERRATIEALKAEVSGLDDAAKLTALHSAERAKALTLDRLEKLNRVQLKALVDAQKVAIKALNEEELLEKKLAQDIAKATAEKTVARKAETKAVDQQKLAEQALREEQVRIVKEGVLRQLEIKLTQQGYQQQIALAKERYNTGLALARDDALQRQIVEAQHQLEIATIEDRALQEHFRRIDARTKAEEKAVQDRLKAEQLAAAKQQQIQDAQMKAYQDFFASYGKGIAQAAAANILFGDSFEEAAASVLKSLAIEAASRALMETAMGIGAAALGSPSAAGHFQSAAIFAATAAAAKIGATALGGGGASTSGGSTASPTGSPQVASAPQREQAESRDMVFNINFGGAVVYDTKEAAKRAMLGDLIRTHNQNNRGMPRFQFAR